MGIVGDGITPLPRQLTGVAQRFLCFNRQSFWSDHRFLSRTCTQADAPGVPRNTV
jgi:hypothetical protein